MYWLVDESRSFIYPPSPAKSWKLALVVGVALPDKGRRKWNKKGRILQHGSEYKPQDETEICGILSDLRIAATRF